MPRSRHLAWIAVFALLAGAATAAEPTAPRSFAPVQDGFTADAPQHLPYAADRLLVQFSPKAMASLAVGAEKGALVPGARTGLARVDALVGNAGVREIVRPYRASADARKAAAFGKDRWFLFHFDGAPDLPRLAAELSADENVDAVSLDWRAFPAAVPNDPIYPSQWGHDNTGQMLSYDWDTHSHENGDPVGTPGFDAHAQEAWDKAQGYGGAGVVIAILDSGVDIDHPDLNLVAGYDFGDNDNNPDDNASGAGHGTSCAGIAAAVANNGLGVAGIAGGSVVMPCKVADSGGSMYFSYIQDALYWAADQGADVISMSLGAAISSDAATDAALAYAWNAGCVIVAATGNENNQTISYPAIHADVMGIGAASPCGDRKRSSSSRLEVNSGVSTDPNGYTCDGERWWGSNYGSTTPGDRGAVDIIAPTIMPTTDIGGSGGYASGDYSLWFNGTSCATPYAAGVAALVIAANPSFTNAQVWDAMTSTATDVVNVEAGTGWDRYSGYGMVNADAAIGGGTPIAPVADFGGTPTSGTYPLNVAFTDLSSGAPTSWSWNFGDGGTASVQNPVHTYAAAGTYTVSLTVANDVGSDTATRTDYITVAAPPAPTAAFSGAPTSGSYPLDVAFTDQSTGSPTSWSWTFGDGGTATVQNPVHTYAAVGT
ncbi:MAG: S8 family serine peptidase, partial [Candidatus Krumholzibacteriia bacterium]